MHVSALYVYPIKSCRGLLVDHVEVQDIGLAHDRRFLVVDHEYTCMTQRDCPAMARVGVSFAGAGWALSRVDMPTFRWTPIVHGVESTVRIWKDLMTAVDQGDDVAEWFSTALGRRCRLMGFAPFVRRPVDPTYAVAPDDAVSFADGYPSLMVSETSLAELNTRTKEAVPMDRFRPNIVVSGVEAAWAEDSWRDFRVGSVAMTAVKTCARCVVTTTDQRTGERFFEPLHTLATYRDIGHGLLFGQNIIHRGRGTIRIGDPVTVLSTQ